MRREPYLTLLFVLIAPLSVAAQRPGPSNPQATALATGALVALSATTQISDVTLTGTATRTAGSEIESGNFTVKALGQYESRLDLVTSSGRRSDVFNISGGTPQGFWVGTDGVPHQMAGHNCMAGVVWFFPSLSVLSQASNPNFTLSYIGPESRDGESVQHLQFKSQVTAVDPTASSGLLGQLGSTDIYLDSVTYLPVAVAFSIHPDNDALTDIPIEVDFSNYQLVQGAKIPFHIQKYMNGTLFLDLTVQTAAMNTGLTDTAFSSY